MTTAITNYATVLSCYCMVISALLIVRRYGLSRQIVPILFFLTCVIFYLIIDFPFKGIVAVIMLAGPFLLPFSFWMVSKSFFSDRSVQRLKYFFIGVFVLVVYYLSHFFTRHNSSNSIVSLISPVISLVFVLLAIYEAQKGKDDDLIDKRKQLRNIFTYTISGIVLITLMVELGLKQTDQELPKLIQRGFILVLSTYILIQNTQWKTFFFSKESQLAEVKDHHLIDQIQQKMTIDNFYSQENLTIGKLAENLEEQEYIVRQVINQQLGYRNFTDFLNSYRITEAKNLLSDLTQRKMTVLEIAYKVGFNSIGPFNRAFKSNTGFTPTDFRKNHLSQS